MGFPNRILQVFTREKEQLKAANYLLMNHKINAWQ